MEEGFFWYPFHGGDFLMKTATMRNDAIACYILLMAHLTRHNRLPKKISDLQLLCRGEKISVIKRSLLAFEKDAGGYYSKEIEEFKRKAILKAAQKKAAGIKGANARWRKQDDLGL